MTDGNPTSPRAGALTLAAFALALLMLFAGLGALPLMQPDEGRNAEVAREMYETGSWLVPTLNGNAYLDKPAFFFKAAALAYSAFGVSEATARLPSALSALGVLVATFLFARRFFGARAAAIAVAVVATTPMFVLFGRIVIMDMTLAVFVVTAIFCGAVAEEYDGRKRLAWITAGAAASGLATIVKGPVGFFLPMLVLGIWHVVERRPRAILRCFHPLPLAVFWGIALAWFIPLCKARPDFLHYGLYEETAKRLTSNSTNRAQPWHFYLKVSLAGCFAWSLLFPEGGIAAWNSRKNFTRAERLCVVWILALMIFFSLSKTKQPGYILTIAVPVGLLIARLFATAWANPSGKAAAIIRRAVFLVAGVLALGGVGLLAAPSEFIAKVFHAAPPTMALMQPMFGPVIAALLVLGAVGFAAALRRSAPVSLLFFAALLPALAGPNMRAIAAYSNNRSSRELARALPPVPRSADFVCIGTLPSALPFYLQRTVTFMDADFGELGSNYILYTLRQTNETHGLVRLDDLENWFAKQTNATFVLCSKRNLEAIGPIAAARGTTVVTNLSKYVHVLLPAR